MATETHTFATLGDNQVTVEYDINNANWKVSQIRVINNSDSPVLVTVYELGVQIFTQVAPANITTSWNTSGIDLGWQDDYWNDITGTWEAAGIEMGDYTVHASWPWGGS